MLVPANPGVAENSPVFAAYPLVNIQKTMENHHFFMGKSTISMVIFNSYVKLPEGISKIYMVLIHRCPLHTTSTNFIESKIMLFWAV